MTATGRGHQGNRPDSRRFLTGFAEFLQLEIAGSIVLLAATILALVLANSPAHTWLEVIGHLSSGVGAGSWLFSQSVQHWIDDGLMALFFFVIGLEVKREIVVGELSSVRQAALPVLAALGGMLAPAAIYLAFNTRDLGARGWGVPMATDIAFALGALAILGSRVPAKLKVFLTSLAIADDIGAILVIALFYSTGISVAWLGAAAVALGALVLLNRARIDSTVPYALLGVVVWFCILNSGVHATIAGVLVALTIPARSAMAPLEFAQAARTKIQEIEDADVPDAHVLENDEQQEAAFAISRMSAKVASPLQRMEHALLPFTTFVVLPLFALANASLRIADVHIGRLVTEPIVLGIFFGLLVGKPLGITLFSWIAVKLRLADLPSGVSWVHIVGAGILGGIGFTMSLFVANLAFRDQGILDVARLAVLVTSACAGAVGYLFLRVTSRETPRLP